MELINKFKEYQYRDYRRYTPPVDAYKAECAEILRRFLEHRLNHQHCIAALDAAVAGVVLRLSPDNLPALQTAILENSRIVKLERIRRGGVQAINRKHALPAAGIAG